VTEAQPGYTATLEVNLSNCDNEPIHLIGAIQPIGFLVVLSSDWVVMRVSANVADHLGRSAQALLGFPFRDVICAEAAHAIRNRLAALQGDAVERAFSIQLQTGGGQFDLAVHWAGDAIVIEAEPSEPAGELHAGAMVRAMLDRMQGQESLTGEAARLVQALTGFDRVMIYYFHPDDSGEVVAERVRSGLEPYLGLHYPAADIPRQARALLLRNPTRMLYDINAEPVPIASHPVVANQPLDLSMSTLRAHSAMHIEYLKNMGVGATMTISLLRDGALWGLISCHHRSPHHISFEQRTTAELFAQMASLLIEKQERDRLATYEARTRQIHNQLIAAVVEHGSVGQNLVDLADRMAELVPCDGLVVYVDGNVTLKGTTPTREELLRLRPFLDSSVASQIYATEALGRVYPPGQDFAIRAAGMLVIPISHSPRDYVVFFRREIVHSVKWAGKPGKLVAEGPNGVRLTPRKSFEAWREIMHGHSAPWTAAELRAAETLRVTLLEVVLHITGQAEKDSRMATQKQELLVAELNHRVRNILGLIRGLVMQTRTTAVDVATYARVLGDRVHALARAHDQITAKNWGPGSLALLIATEAGAYLGVGADRIHATGPGVLLEPQAFSTVTLVIHELMTNAAKYGALSGLHGRVIIDWTLDASGGIVIDWRETGGPPVQAPARRGFGTTIVENSIPHELGGDAKLSYMLMGLQARFTLPAHHVVLGDTAAVAVVPHTALPVLPAVLSNVLSGCVLLVEDNMIIALNAEDILLTLGAARVSVAGNVGEALHQIELETPSFALLDINLGLETSWPVARRLRELGVPHAFATGYGNTADYPPEHRGTPSITKPYSIHTIARVVGECALPGARQDENPGT
jgi:light-regulated signal transduction histidine kinase (bacteriophytochrome)/CheY-like chemotaxis protein